MSGSPIKVDREKDCPFLLRVYSKVGRHHHIQDYQVDSLPPAEDEIVLYTWKDATLGELALLLQDVIPEARHPDARMTFRLVYLDARSARFQQTDIGRVVNAEDTPDHSKTLADCKFLIGDYLDIAVHIGPPRNDHRQPHGHDDRGDRSHNRDSGFSFRGRGRRHRY